VLDCCAGGLDDLNVSLSFLPYRCNERCLTSPKLRLWEPNLADKKNEYRSLLFLELHFSAEVGIIVKIVDCHDALSFADRENHR
jgi:hypothetical protein